MTGANFCLYGGFVKLNGDCPQSALGTHTVRCWRPSGMPLVSHKPQSVLFHSCGPVKSPTYQDVENIAQKIAERVSRYLEKSGYLIRDLDTEYLDLNTENEAIQSIIGASITYRLAFGPNAGKKALTLKTLPATFEAGHHDEQVSKRAGFSLHAGIACKAGQGKKRERICRYITRPAIAERGGRLRIITGEWRQRHC